MYKIINKELKIAACEPKDITAGMISRILSSLEDGTHIGELTVFWDVQEGYLVLNSDSPLYDALLAIAERYLVAGREERDEIYEKAPAALKSSILVIRKFRVESIISREIFRASEISAGARESRILREIFMKYDGILAMFVAFGYGVMCGKRTERARRRKRGAEA